MTPKLQISGILALVLALTSCAKKTEEPNPHSSVYEIPTKNLAHSLALAKISSVDCETAEQCPNSVGMLVVAKERSLGLCTSFLVSPNILATNSHCIPDEVKSGTVSCAERMEVFFPALSENKERFRCEKVLTASPAKNILEPDYAFLQLQHSPERDFFTLSKAGLADNSKLTLYKVDPVDTKSPKGILRTSNCTVIQNSFLAPDFDHHLRPIATVADCNFAPGNSGSPLLNTEGRVAALAQGFAKSLDHPTAKKALNDLLGNVNFAPFLMATNISCINLPWEPRQALPSECFPPPSPKTGTYVEGKIPTEMELAFQRNLDSWQTQNSSEIRWRVNRLYQGQYSLKFFPSPECVENPSQLFKAPQRELLFHLPVLHIKMRLNKYLKSSIETSNESIPSLAVLHYHYFSHKTEAKLFLQGESAAFYQGEIPLCNPSVIKAVP